MNNFGLTKDVFIGTSNHTEASEPMGAKETVQFTYDVKKIRKPTNYERMCSDKIFAASVLSAAWNKYDYEDDDYDPAMMKWFDKEAQG